MSDPALPSPHPNHTRVYVVLALGLIGMGFSGIFVALAGAPGAVSGFYRMAIAAAALAIPFALRIRRESPQRREISIALLAGLFFAGDLIFWNTGILISGATNPTLMGNTAPIWVSLGAMFFFHETLNRRFWTGLAVAIAGAALILGLDAMRDVGLGTLFGIFSGMFYAGYFLVTQRSRQQLSSLTSFWLSAVGSSVALFIAALLLGQPLVGYPAETWLAFLGMGILVQVLGQFAVNYALGYLPASIVSPTLLAQPVLTGLLAVPILGEALSVGQIIGGIAVLVGVFIVHRSRAADRVPLPAALE
jgi:drug/metabolite transporter (DMT)-like permease